MKKFRNPDASHGIIGRGTSFDARRYWMINSKEALCFDYIGNQKSIG